MHDATSRLNGLDQVVTRTLNLVCKTRDRRVDLFGKTRACGLGRFDKRKADSFNAFGNLSRVPVHGLKVCFDRGRPFGDLLVKRIHLLREGLHRVAHFLRHGGHDFPGAGKHDVKCLNRLADALSRLSKGRGHVLHVFAQHDRELFHGLTNLISNGLRLLFGEFIE